MRPPSAEHPPAPVDALLMLLPRAASPRGLDAGCHRHREPYAFTNLRRSSPKPGYETSAASKPSTSTPSRDAIPATAPSIASRWSPDAPASRRQAARALHHEAVRRCLDTRAEAAQALDDRRDAVGLLAAQLLGARHRRASLRERAEQRHQRAARRSSAAPPPARPSVAASAAAPHDELGRPAHAARGRAVRDLGRAAHPLQHSQQARARGIQPDASSRAPSPARVSRPRSERRRGEVAGHHDVAPARGAPAPANRDDARRVLEPAPAATQHPLGVVTAAHGLDDGRSRRPRAAPPAARTT